MTKPTALIIMDGFAFNENAEGNAIKAAKTPYLDKLFEEVRDSAYKIIEAKGATYYAIAEAVRKIVSAIVRNENTVLTVSSLLEGQYGFNDICLGLPSIVGAEGVKEILEIPLDERERNMLNTSANKVHEIIKGIELNTLYV